MTSNDKYERPLAMVFLPPVMSPEHALCAIDRALDYRAKASDSVRDRLNFAIKATVSVQSFRDASIAPRQQLRDPLFAAILTGNGDKLAGEVLRAWAESQEALRTIVSDHLDTMGMSVEGPDLQRGVFRSTWPLHEWTFEVESIANGVPDSGFDDDDIALMLCYVSGRLPAEPQVETESPLFQQWLDELSELPPDAPEWDYADEFATAVAGLAYEKIAERRTVLIETVANSIAEIKEEFDDELQYLEIDIGSWSADDAVSSGVIEPALEKLTELKSVLSEYRPIRPQAPSRSEESLRAPERESCEKLILGIVSSWDELISVPEDPVVDPASQASTDTPEEKESDRSSTTDADAIDTVLTEILGSDSINPEIDYLIQVNESLSSENAQLRQDSDHLRADVSTLKDQIGRLRSELSQSNEMEEYWRRAYVSESARQVGTEEDGPIVLSNITDALELAAKSFPDQLRIALNSKSNSDTPFQKPDEAFEALGWLATEYHRLRSNPGDAPNFDKLIKEACPGWSYKSKQTEVTKDQFTEWYTTTLDGKSYELDAHIGKGTSYDPQQTIRIAFDWDDELKQVIVGYVGRHQRNRRS